MLNAPRFWRERGLWAELLLAFSVLYYLYLRFARPKKKPVQLPVQVICVGNATVGGAGKTPAALALGQEATARSIPFAFISRGYGGSVNAPLRVNPATHTAAQVGDEALLLARTGPCWVGKSRLAIARAAIENGAKLLILDDGLQDDSLHKTLSLCVIDGPYGLGNGYLLPAGPLREKFEDTLAKAKHVLIIGEDRQAIAPQITALTTVSTAQLVPMRAIDPAVRYVAFAGIGRPEKFFATLESAGANVVLRIGYPDHHRYSGYDISQLEDAMRIYNAQLVTTEKDAVKLPEPFRARVGVLPVALRWDNAAYPAALLEGLGF